MTDRRSLLRAIFDAAVAAAHPDVVLSAHLRPAPKGRVICLAAGKGAAAMAAAAERHYLDTLGLDPARLTGLATTRHGHGVPTRRIRVIEVGHPVPDEAGLKAADETLRLAAEATADDLLLVLLSGGGSANWIAPADGVSFTQKQQVNRALLRSGAPIGEMNIVRKHLSRIKGGRLARAGQRAAEIVTLAISDVPHDDPSAIASGPTVPDPSTLADARALAAGTDGADGGAGSATDPAGAVIDQATFAKMKSLGLDPAAYLANNDATAFFSATGDLLLTGPTLTNVNDVRVILVDPA